MTLVNRIENPRDPFERPEVPLPLSAYSGSWLKIDSRKNRMDFPLAGDGEIYSLAVVPDDPRENTHKARCEGYFWEGNEQEFRKQFQAV
jgi:hypothetical protein